MIATTSGACSIRLCFWSMKPAVLPETRAAVAPGGPRSRIAVTRVLRVAAEGRVGEGEVGVGDRRPGAGEGGAADDAVDRFDAALEGRQLGVAGVAVDGRP